MASESAKRRRKFVVFLLFCRLEAYDRNKNFTNACEIILDKPQFDWPHLEYKTLQQCHHSMISSMTTPQVGYFPTSSDHSDVYVTGIVRAAMNKKVCFLLNSLLIIII